MDEPYILSNDDLLKQLQHRIDNRIATSAVRKSDGENVVLAFGVYPEIPMKKYLKKLEHYNLKPWNLGFQLFLRSELIRAFRNADFLGISRPEMRRKFWAQELEILEYFELTGNSYCDLEFHFDFIRNPKGEIGLMNSEAERMLTNRKLGIISHQNVTEMVQALKSEIVFQTAIPRRRARWQSMTREIYDSVSADIRRYNDEVDFWIVGAGVYAKPFCEDIRCLGGIGLDLGSSLDSWANDFQTRRHLRKIYSEQQNS